MTVMTKRVLLLAVAGLLVSGIEVRADSWTQPVPQEFKSRNGEYAFVTTPIDRFKVKPVPLGHCEAELFKVTKEGKRELVWSRHLINDLSPYSAVVSDSGEYVVTFDDWGEMGKLPVVIYGPKGELKKAFDIESLVDLDGEDGKHIFTSTSGPSLSHLALSFFGEDDEILYVRLQWGRILMFNCKYGLFLGQSWDENKRKHRVWVKSKENWDRLYAYGEGEVPKRILELLDKRDERNLRLGAILAAEANLTNAIPKLWAIMNEDRAFVSMSGKPANKQVIYGIRYMTQHALGELGEDTSSVKLEKP